MDGVSTLHTPAFVALLVHELSCKMLQGRVSYLALPFYGQYAQRQTHSVTFLLFILLQCLLFLDSVSVRWKRGACLSVVSWYDLHGKASLCVRDAFKIGADGGLLSKTPHILSTRSRRMVKWHSEAKGLSS